VDVVANDEHAVFPHCAERSSRLFLSLSHYPVPVSFPFPIPAEPAVPFNPASVSFPSGIMSASHGGSSSIAAQPIQSLPSFAQAFSNSTLNRMSPSQPVLPPIQPRPALSESRRVNSSPPGSSARPTENDAAAVAGKKRSRTDSGMANRNDLESECVFLLGYFLISLLTISVQ
jgi:hypothetical protein